MSKKSLEVKLPKVPVGMQDKFTNIILDVKSFCNEKLNDEYYNLILKLLTKIARKRPSPLLTGKPKTWAAGSIHAIGMVNFLFDKTQNPHLPAPAIASWFDLSSSTISAKSKSIRDMFNMVQLDPRWALPSKMDDNPMVWMIMVDGFIIDARTASYDLQVAAYKAGVIPYIPGNKPPLDVI